MNKLTINQVVHEIPSIWNEMNLGQQLRAYATLMTDFQNLFDTFELLPAKRILLLDIITNGFVNAEFFDSLKADCLEEYEDREAAQAVFTSSMEELLKLTDFFFEKIETPEEEPEKYQIALTLTKCPWPFFEQKKNKKQKLKKLKYYGPADKLANISIYELGVTFTFFEKFMKDQNEADALQLLAILYREAKPATKYNKQRKYEGDRRQPYLGFEATVEGRKKYLHRLPIQVKQLLVFWFASCRDQIVKNNPGVFQSGGKKQGRNFGWAGVLLNLSEGLVNLDRVSAQPYQNAFTHLSMLEEQRKRFEKK